MQMYRQQVRGGQDEQASVLGDFVAAECSPEFLQPLDQMKVQSCANFCLVQNGGMPSVWPPPSTSDHQDYFMLCLGWDSNLNLHLRHPGRYATPKDAQHFTGHF